MIMSKEELSKAMRKTKREIVLKNLHKLLLEVKGYPVYEDCIDYAIEELEQEPIIDKIRAEITELRDGYEKDNYHDEADALTTALAIYDKYKVESEGEK